MPQTPGKHVVSLYYAIITESLSKTMLRLHDHYINSSQVRMQKGKKNKVEWDQECEITFLIIEKTLHRSTCPSICRLHKTIQSTHRCL